MIVATAGHVDHGKTSLVQALTGIDTDRLAEEKRRGLSIDLGFAYADFGGARRMGFVDVPGHERFVRNMLAGVGGVDLALLVVAADDGPMPQTHEHLAILRLLGVPRCVVALTKIDRVAPERVRHAERDIAALLAAGPYAQAPVFPLATPSSDGVAALREHLREAGEALAARAGTGHFRMAVDRSFAVAGAGRVVTGMVLSGAARVGDAVIVSPGGAAARVRAIHAQNESAEWARVGERCALNLAGLELRRTEPARGDWIVAPEAHAPTTRLDVQLEVLADAPRALTQRSALHLHIGAAACGAHVAPLQAGALEPGASGLAQLVLDAPVAALRGDRFILRDPTAHGTVAGGWVIDPFGPPRGRARPVRLQQLAALALPTPAQALAALLEGESAGIDLARFDLACNLTAAESTAVHAAVPLVQIAGDGGARALSSSHWQAWCEAIPAALAGWHADDPASVGPSSADLAARMNPRPPTAVLHAALTALVHDGTVARDGLRVRLHAHRAVLSEADAALLARVTTLLEPTGLRPPIVGELATALALPLPELLASLMRAAHLGQLVRVAPNRYYLPPTVDELVQIAHALAGESDDGGFDAAAFRDRTGIGRNLTVQVLEFMDREHLMHFDGARRRPAVREAAC